uniref:Uncharacterized protein n=1 Tax=viral metagenome TaxID=1070528 RepID=A0A6C0EQM6_9ZZZZ
MDDVTGYSETEKYENYMQIIKTLEFIEKNGRITEDWMEENKAIIEKWRDMINDYSRLNPEITSKYFRKDCNDTEVLIQYLIASIRSTKTFDIKVYVILLQKMKAMCDHAYDDMEMNELMNGLSLQ